jgi:membrane associated rhomboid family serine protease
VKPLADAERRTRELAASLPKASGLAVAPVRAGVAVPRTLGGTFKRFVKVFGGIVGTLSLVTLANTLTLGAVNTMFALLPRTWSGAPGIVLHPLLHANFAHLAMNALGIVTIGGVVFLRSERDFWRVTIFATLFGGTLTWLIGRPDYHVGASGVVFGYLGYLLTTGWFDRKAGAILISLGAAALWGSALVGLSPLQQGVSWELHAAGLVAGVIAASWRRKQLRVR